ncbi:ABC transporter ATP-binding protein [Salipiger sp. P9]|uniref:ABC transporter ATP-binding protein n=1 Tax=Salipiger pentaromativorans TaxID=2943193 RepID=UPI002157BA96|nr:ABC transporter ATP-binding protein [Salipiger pentaromativorans]MCR8549430.1 ABC transporter ATP-binding protein [Salipiger pentaromativorans]
MAPILSARHIRKSYGAFVALRDISLDIPHGERHALIGPNGAGKSTFIACLAGQLSGVEGQMLFKDENVAALPPAALARRGIGRTFQISRAFLQMTVLENLMAAHVIASGRWAALSRRIYGERIDRAHEMLVTVGLADRARDRVADLSLGDRKRLEFGMALVGEPELLLLDEPTAGMSIKERHGLMDMVAERLASEGRTLLFVEHDIDVVMKIAQRVTVMVRGAVLAVGTPEEIAANDEVQAVYLGGGH